MAIRTIFGKKKRFGIAEKQRSKEEVDREYGHHAMMYGHISRMMAEHEDLLRHHLESLQRLAREGSKIPAEKPKDKTPEAPQPV